MAVTGQVLLTVICIVSIQCVPIVPGRFFNFLTRPLQALQRPPGILGAIPPLGILGPKPISGVLNTLGIGSRSGTEHIPGLTSVNGAQDSFGLNDLLGALGFNNGISTLQDGQHLSKPINALTEGPGEAINGDYEGTENTGFEPTEGNGDDDNKEGFNTISSENSTDKENPDEFNANKVNPDEENENNEKEEPDQKPSTESSEEYHTVEPEHSKEQDSDSENISNEISKESNEKKESDKLTEETNGDEENEKEELFATATENFVETNEKGNESLIDDKTIRVEASNQKKEKLKPNDDAPEDFHTAEQPY